MSIALPFHLQIPELRNLNSKRKEVLDEQQKLLNSLSQLEEFAGLVVSLRYVYDPTKEPNQKLKIYLSINHADGDRSKVDSALNIINKGGLRDFYKFQSLKSQPHLIDKTEDWVKVICEITKDEKFPKNQEYYIPYLFQPDPNNDMFSVCKQLNVLDKKLIIDITLQTSSPYEKEIIETTIKQFFRDINKNNSRYYKTHFDIEELNVARDIYNQYLNYYVTNNKNLFKYSARILAESSYDIDLVVIALIQNAFRDDSYGQKHHSLILKPNSEEFRKCLMATKKVELFTGIERSEWKSDFEQQLAKGSSRSGNSHRHIIRLPETEALPADDNLLSSTGELVKADDSWSLGKYFENSPDSNKILNNSIDLKLLHRLVTPQEISSLFRIVVSGDVPVPGIPQEQPSFIKPTAEELFKKYSHEITEDKYIVGMTDDGRLVCSEWNVIAHRLVAGVNGSGRTNFLHWVIFQFLYANPERKVYILDFKEVDFPFYEELEFLKENVKLVTEIEQVQDLLDRIYSEDYQERQRLMREKRVSNILQLQKSGVTAHRILLVVDEAADIPIKCKTTKMLDAIQGKLEEYARKGRSFGIHLMYCTQTPKTGLISAQVTSQLDERVIFRVSEDAGDSVLGNLFAAATKIPLGDSGRGRAIWRGSEGTMYVNTPKIEIPDACIRVDKTLWSKICAKF